MINTISQRFNKRTIIFLVLLTIAFLSFFVVSKTVTAPSFNAENIKSLDDKKVTVMKLAAASAATSSALSLIPGDAAMPIAEQIAELSTYFIIILCAILLEKMLISVIGYMAFAYIIPVACLLGILSLWVNMPILRELAIKLGIFAIVIFMAIPASIKVSDIIYSTYRVSVEQTLETTKQSKEDIEKKKKDFDKEDKSLVDKLGDYLPDFTSKIGNGISDIAKKGEDTLSLLLDTIAVLIITSCVIPIIVILIFAWIIKILFGFSIKLPIPQNKGLMRLHKNHSTDI